MRDVDRVRARQKKKERLTAEEMEACRDAVKDDRERALLELMLSTGRRAGEIAALRIEDIDFQAKRLHVREGKTDNLLRVRVTPLTVISIPSVNFSGTKLFWYSSFASSHALFKHCPKVKPLAR